MQDRGTQLTPTLRFPEFGDDDEWAPETLGMLFSERKETDFLDLPLLSLTDQEGMILQEDTNRKNNSNPDKSRYLRVCRGDIAYNTMRMWQGRSAYVGLEGLVSPAYTVCKPGSGTNSLFFSYYFKTPWLIEQFKRYSQGLVNDTLNLKYEPFSKITVCSPQPDEQQKIADCLTSLDEVIAAQARKVAALKAHKKGLMQQLFPREGETQPRRRFREFRTGPNWTEHSLRDVCERIMDGTHFSPKTKSGPRPYLTSKNIRDGSIDLSTASYVSEEEHREIYSRCPVAKFDVLLTKDGASTGNCAINNLNFEFSLLSSVAVLRVDASQLEHDFLFQLVTSECTQSLIRNSMSGQAITRITLKKIEEFVVPIPTPKEQRRIADCLCSLDNQIAARAKKLDALKTHKKGLMQQLFPSPEAV